MQILFLTFMTFDRFDSPSKPTYLTGLKHFLLCLNFERRF